MYALLSASPDDSPFFATVFNKVVFNIVMFHQLHDRADRACFEYNCRQALDDTFEGRSRAKLSAARPSDQNFQEAFCAHLTEKYAPFASLSTKDQFLLLLATETEVPVFLENKINKIPGRRIHLSEDRKLNFIKLGDEIFHPSDINRRTLEKFFDSGVLGNDRASAQRQPQANNSPPPPPVDQTEPIVEIKKEVEQVEDEQDKQPDPFYVKPEPHAEFQSESQPKPTHAEKVNRSYRFTPYPTKNPQNQSTIQNDASRRLDQKRSIETKPNKPVPDKSEDIVTPVSVRSYTSSVLNQQEIPTVPPKYEKTTQRTLTKQVVQTCPDFSRTPLRRLQPTSQPGPSNVVGHYLSFYPKVKIAQGVGWRTSNDFAVQQLESLAPPVPVDRENREATRITFPVLHASASTSPVPTPAQRLASPPCPALIALLTAPAISPIPTPPPVSDTELPMEPTTMPSSNSPMLPKKVYPTCIRKRHLLETLRDVAQYANLTQLQKDVEKDLTKIGSEHMIDAEQVLTNLQAAIMNMGMFSKKGTEGSGLMKSSKAFMLMLHFAEQFDPLRHLTSDRKVEKAKEENMENVIDVEEVEHHLYNLRRIFAHVR
ncbi:hypothetical protein B9Z55_017483 [Caenorhabditis nigoni]|nr:hypothetical protein B9Z55_017483 [Caenorhabditis nigoni]